MKRFISALLSFVIAASPLESAWAQVRSGRAAASAPAAVALAPIAAPLSPAALLPGLLLGAPGAAPTAIATPASARPSPLSVPAPAAAAPVIGVRANAPKADAAHSADSSKTVPSTEKGPAESDAAEGAAVFDGAKDKPAGKGTVAEGQSSEAVKELLKLRRDVQKDARKVLREQMGGDVGDGILHRDLNRVAARLVRAAGLPKEAAQVFDGNSFLPNAFTTITKSEAKFIEEKSSVAKPFRVANVFLSLGLLRAVNTKDGKITAWDLVKLGFRRAFLSPAKSRAELSALIEKL